MKVRCKVGSDLKSNLGTHVQCKENGNFSHGGEKEKTTWDKTPL